MKKEKLNEEQIIPVAPDKPEIGIDTQKTIISDIIDGVQVGGIDVSSIDALSNSAQNREQTYELIDAMASDEIIAAILKIYVSETVQTNDRGEKM